MEVPQQCHIHARLALHHPGDMEVHLLSIPTFTFPVPTV